MDKHTLGQRIAARRKGMNLSQEALAERLDVSRQAVSKWESDRTVPEIDKLISMGRIFEVSVGWLLGTERDPEPGGEPGFSQQQIDTLEELFYRDRPRRRMQMRVAAAAAAAAVVLGGVVIASSQQKLARLNQEQIRVQEQITALAEDNLRAEDRWNQLNEMVSQQVQTSRLISDLNLQTSVSEDLQAVSSVLYLTPKVYQQRSTAYLSVENPANGFHTFVDCVFNGVQYVARFTVPVADGYRFSFLLVNDYGFEEENLSLRDPGFALLETYSSFHLVSAQELCQPVRNEVTYRAKTDGVYTFNRPVHTPHVFAQTAIAFREVNLSLTLNGEEIWSESRLDELEAMLDGTANRLNGAKRVLMPEVQVALPELAPGDRLELVLTARTVNGGAQPQNYRTVLDVQEVAEEAAP